MLTKMNARSASALRQRRNPAVVLGGDTNGLGHVRALGKAGIYTYVVCAGVDDQNLSRFSRYSTPITVLGGTARYEFELKSRLLSLAEAHEAKPVLFATSDFFVDFVSRHRLVLGEQYLFNLPGDAVLQLVTNKYRTDQVARAAGVRSPRTLVLKASDSVESISTSVSYPCIVKPQDSFSLPFPGKNRIVLTPEELRDFFTSYPQLKEHVVVQEIIPGGERSIFQCTAYIGNNTPSQFFTIQKIHQRPPGYGVTTIGRSVEAPELLEGTRKLLEHLDYVGFASVEFKRSEADGHFYLIEVNPRLPWYNSLFTSCEVNFPYLAYSDLVDGEAGGRSPEPAQRNNVYWIHFGHELSGLAQRPAAGMPLELSATVASMTRATSFAYFDPRDLKPFVMSVIALLKSIWRKLKPHKRSKAL